MGTASNILVTKAGPGTIAEAMIVGLPLVLSTFLPGQEAGNVPYVVDGGFGLYGNEDSACIAECVQTLLNDERRLTQMSKIAKSIAESNSCYCKRCCHFITNFPCSKRLDFTLFCAICFRWFKSYGLKINSLILYMALGVYFFVLLDSYICLLI